MNDIIKIVLALENQSISLKGVTKTVGNEMKEQKGGFLSMLMGTLGASLLSDILTKNLIEKGIYRTGYENKQEIFLKSSNSTTSFNKH